VFDAILFEKQAGIATVTMNRPAKLNAMTWPMIEEFLDAVEDCRQDDDVRVLVFTGAGRAFSAGDDIVDGMGERTRGGNPGGLTSTPWMNPGDSLRPTLM
jgi:enoyl-CoA hydratase/carnithine racemase